MPMHVGVTKLAAVGTVSPEPRWRDSTGIVAMHAQADHKTGSSQHAKS